MDKSLLVVKMIRIFNPLSQFNKYNVIVGEYFQLINNSLYLVAFEQNHLSEEERLLLPSQAGPLSSSPGLWVMLSWPLW